jgi:hypothetical protein
MLKIDSNLNLSCEHLQERIVEKVNLPAALDRAKESSVRHRLEVRGPDDQNATEGGRMIVAAALLLAAVEIRITDYLWRSPTRLRGVLGKVESRRSECADARGGRQTNYERGYVCVRNGRIVVLGYDLRREFNSPEEALAAVGLKMLVRPESFDGGAVYMWSVAHGNALPVGHVRATRVIARIRGGAGVTVDVGGD